MKRLSLFCSIFILIIFISMEGTVVMARAGGGGSSSGGSSSSSSSSSSRSSSSSSRYSDSHGRNSPIGFVLTLIPILLFTVGKTVYSAVRDYKIYLKTKKMLRALSKIDDMWDYNKLKIRVNKTFYTVQSAWMNRNHDLAREYMSKNIYDLHTSKTDWMTIRHEKNILENIRILSITPVAVQDFMDSSQNIIWFSIRASMEDYTIDDITMEIVDGNRAISMFREYWKFVREDSKWVLDEIRQKDEFYNTKACTNYSEKLK
ncbi:Tim44 domain-containing protein [Hathewaya histolytica]|uniref:Tim44 domain-containing protein n=1 Tax=Hathewaya histolytica TaxID=1498 RepID=UPI003B67B026